MLQEHLKLKEQILEEQSKMRNQLFGKGIDNNIEEGGQ